MLLYWFFASTTGPAPSVPAQTQPSAWANPPARQARPPAASASQGWSKKPFYSILFEAYFPFRTLLEIGSENVMIYKLDNSIE